jgi:hypothetical protein
VGLPMGVLILLHLIIKLISLGLCSRVPSVSGVGGISKEFEFRALRYVRVTDGLVDQATKEVELL